MPGPCVRLTLPSPQFVKALSTMCERADMVAVEIQRRAKTAHEADLLEPESQHREREKAPHLFPGYDMRRDSAEERPLPLGSMYTTWGTARPRFGRRGLALVRGLRAVVNGAMNVHLTLKGRVAVAEQLMDKVCALARAGGDHLVGTIIMNNVPRADGESVGSLCCLCMHVGPVMPFSPTTRPSPVLPLHHHRAWSSWACP